MDDQMDAHQTRDKLIEDLSQLCNLDRDAIIDNALMLLGFAVTEIIGGRIIASVNESQKIYKEVKIPAFNNVDPSAESIPTYRH